MTLHVDRVGSERRWPSARGFKFLSLAFTNASIGEVVDYILAASEQPEWRYAVTPNASHLARLVQDNAGFSAAYSGAALCVLDSRVVAACARLTGLAVPRVVPGSDLVQAVLDELGGTPRSVCVVGCSQLIIDRLCGMAGMPHISHVDVPMGFWSSDCLRASIVAQIVAARAQLTFIAIGSPQQELLAEMVARSGGAGGMAICCGAAIEFATGAKKRAPIWMQGLALEWAYRLAMEPKRLAFRYLIESPLGLVLVLREAVKLHLRRENWAGDSTR